MTKTRGVLIATAAAGLILAGTVTARADEKAGGDKVQCAGVNSCKGQGACGGAGHACAGKNSCKGQGWVEMGKDQCLKQGGKIVDGESK